MRGPQGLSEPINITTGLKQGDILSPLLFNLALEGVLRGMRTHPFDADGNIVELPGILGYADDLALLADSEEEAVTMAAISWRAQHPLAWR